MTTTDSPTPARVLQPGEVAVSAADLGVAVLGWEGLAEAGTLRPELRRLVDAYVLAEQPEPAADEPARDSTGCAYGCGEPVAAPPAEQGEEPWRCSNEGCACDGDTPASPADREQQRVATLPDTWLRWDVEGDPDDVDSATLPDTPWTTVRVTLDDGKAHIWRAQHTPGEWRECMPANERIPNECVARVQSYITLAEPPIIDADELNRLRRSRDYYRNALDASVRGQLPVIDKRTEPASGQPGRVVASMPVEHAAYVDIEVRAAEDRAVKRAVEESTQSLPRTIQALMKHTDEAVARIRAEGYLAVGTLVSALEELARLTSGGAAALPGDFQELANMLIRAQSGQPNTEKEAGS